MVFEAYSKVKDLLNPWERRQALFLAMMILIMGLLEMVRVASIVPFVAALADPSVIKTNVYLSAAYDWFGFETTTQFMAFIGTVVFVLLVCSLSFTALTSWATLRFANMRGYALSRGAFESYLDRPYEWFLSRNSAELGNTVLGEAHQVVSGALMPLVHMFTSGVVAAGMITLLVVADPVLAFAVVVVLGGGYWAIHRGVRHYLARIGAARIVASQERFRLCNEAFGGIKDLKVLGLESAFLARFEKPSLRLVRFQVLAALIRQLPGYAFQIVAFASVLGIVWYQMLANGSLTEALPIIALYALAGQRLMPALQKIYAEGARLSHSKPALDSLHHDLMQRELSPGAGPLERPAAASPLGLHDHLELRAVSYRYPGAAAPALRDVDMTIPALTSVGLVGHTGAGKTTMVDIILGLLEPTDGAVVVDGQPIGDDNRRKWQRSVGYVPQHIFLSDDTVAANIAFGVPPKDIDLQAVESAARTANLHDFVANELPEGYDTLIGERGMRLSGGQRQRVGIARALYRDPELLIMDEGTSALDNVTEAAVMDAVNNLARAKTVILIAHRLSTVQACNQIFLLERGRVTAVGSFDELVAGHEEFRKMATGRSSDELKSWA